ncbi:MAG: hypothetical protein CMO10_12870 [Thalassospira sp.]|nr:hypothetical protein [Thalassospira sp.]
MIPAAGECEIVRKQEYVTSNLLHFAEDIFLPCEKRSDGRSGATFEDLDAAGWEDVPAHRVWFWRSFAALHRLTDAPHRSARCALPNSTPKPNKAKQI